LLSSIGEFQGNFCHPVLHALTLTRSCHVDSAPYRRRPQGDLEYLLQPLFVRTTALPSCPSSPCEMTRHSASGSRHDGRGGSPRGSAASHVPGAARGLAHGFLRGAAGRGGGWLLPERDGRDASGARCPCARGSCHCGRLPGPQQAGNARNLRCGKVILVFGPCEDVRQANGATDLVQQPVAARENAQNSGSRRCQNNPQLIQ
jgi:hypothetical protein